MSRKPDPRLGRMVGSGGGHQEIIVNIGSDGVVWLSGPMGAVAWSRGEPLPEPFLYIDQPLAEQPHRLLKRADVDLHGLALRLRDQNRHDDARKVERIRDDLVSLSFRLLQGDQT